MSTDYNSRDWMPPRIDELHPQKVAEKPKPITCGAGNFQAIPREFLEWNSGSVYVPTRNPGT